MLENSKLSCAGGKGLDKYMPSPKLFRILKAISG